MDYLNELKTFNKSDLEPLTIRLSKIESNNLNHWSKYVGVPKNTLIRFAVTRLMDELANDIQVWVDDHGKIVGIE